MKMDPTAKVLIGLGVGLIILGLGWASGVIQTLRIGRLPGDIFIQKDNFSFYFPLTTGILISGIIYLVSWILKR